MNIKETNLMLRQNSASTRELTTQARERYSKGGEIFMDEQGENLPKTPEGGQNFVKKTEQISPSEQLVNKEGDRGKSALKAGSADAVARAEDAWIKHNEGKNLSSEERVMQRLLRALGKMPGESLSEEETASVKLRMGEILQDPLFQETHLLGMAGKVPLQEAVLRRRQERLANIEVKAQLNMINTEGVSDSVLESIAGTYNRKLGKGLIEYSDIDKTVRDIEDRLRNATIIKEDKAWGKDVIDSLELSMINVKSEKEEDAEKSNRAYRERETGQRKYTIKELVLDRSKRDEVFNDLFAGVDSTPHEFFDRAFNPLTYGMRYETFMDLIREASVGKLEGVEVSESLGQELAKDFIRYQTERRVRQNLHDVNAALYLPSLTADQLFDHMQQFSSDLGDFAFREDGVRQMMDLYEAAIRESMMEKNGYLDPEALLGKVSTVTQDEETKTIISIGEIERKTKARFSKRLKEGQIVIKDEKGNPLPVGDFKSWEIDRTFTTARGMMIVTERLISLAAESNLPKGSFGSLFLQDVIQSYSAYIHLIGKFGISEKDLAAYLYQKGGNQGLLSFLRGWNPKDLEKTLNKFQEDPGAFINDPKNQDDMRYLMLRNPNRAGDIFTWLSWRAQEKPDAVSMSRDFLSKGKAKMEERLRLFEATDPNFLEKLRVSSEETHDQLKEKYLNEYANWIGTGLRLERIRTRLSVTNEELKMLKNGNKKQKEEAGKIEKEQEKGHDIIMQMVMLQPHRLYLASSDIRRKVNKILDLPEDQKDFNEEQKEYIANVIDNLFIVENTILQKREELLKDRKVFDMLSLEPFLNDSLAIPEHRIHAKRFIHAIIKDFVESENKYFKEFASPEREYKHGFVLWSGDAPVDEFNASALGPSGGFARRARDNKAQAEAIKEEIKLLSSLKHITNPDQAIQLLIPIYDKIAMYDAGKAKKAIAEKAEGIAKFYAADALTNVPILGTLMRLAGRSSMAQITFDDRRAGVWQAYDVKHFLTELKRKDYITKEQYDILEGKTYSTAIDIGLDIGSTMSQFIAIALIWYLADKLSKEK